jgi:hypothetical protein
MFLKVLAARIQPTRRTDGEQESELCYKVLVQSNFIDQSIQDGVYVDLNLVGIYL